MKNWLQAFRLKTLPLAFASITMGAFAANIQNVFSWQIYLLALLTALFLQILSNLANDYGDFKKGTDNSNRVGPTRALQSGIISEGAMLKAVILFSLFSLVSGLLLLWVSLKDFGDTNTLIMLSVGLAAIAAAIKYTVGKNAYGYSGLGDAFVFIFFGIVSVLGTYFLMAKTIDSSVFLPAISVGGLAVGVLNINNLRDIENDKASNKITLAVRLGRKRTKTYQTILTLVSFLALSNYLYSNTEANWFYLSGMALWLPILFSHNRIASNQEGEEALLNNELKAYSLGTALISFGVFGLSFLL
jgi:1,4-dihydroxy-2-naphthoate octaprenyltransferase